MSRHFALGIALGLAFGLVPDIPSAIQMTRDNPELTPYVTVSYIVLAVIVAFAVVEGMD